MGEQPACPGSVDFFVTENQRSWISLKAEGSLPGFPYHLDFDPVASYRQRYHRIETTVNKMAGSNTYSPQLNQALGNINLGWSF